MSAEKIAVSLDPALLSGVEALRRRTGESRSAVVARALRALLDEERRRARVAEYVEAYRRLPETPAEIEAASRLADEALAAVAWDDDP